MHVTRHARVRTQQRAIRPGDIDLIEKYGTSVPVGYLMRTKDVVAAVAELREMIRSIERLKNRALVFSGDRLVTAYVAGREKQKKLLAGRTRRLRTVDDVRRCQVPHEGP